MKFKLCDLSEEELIRRLNILKEFKLDNNQVFLFYGTLLGCVREQKVIGHDDDIDIAYLSNKHTKEDVKEEMLDIYKALNSKGVLLKYFNLNYEEVFNFDNMVFGLGQCHILIDGFVFDLFTTWIDENGFLNTYEFGPIDKSNKFFPLKKGILNGIEFNIPNNPEILLEEIYGSDWRTPQNKKSDRERKIVLR